MVITGACGHLGSLLIRRLLAKGEPLTLIDNFYTQKQCSLFGIQGKVEFIEADVGAIDPKVFKDQVVVHLAAIAEPQTSIDRPDYVLEYNTALTRAVVGANPMHLIFASSAGVYGPQSEIVTENCTTFNPQTAYALGKLKDEALVRSLDSYTIFRFGTLFGPSLGMRFHTAVNKFCWQAATGQPLTVWQGAYNQTRPYLDISDACEAIMSYKWQGIYNLATCHATVADVVGLIQHCIPSTRIKIVASPPMDQSTYQIWCKVPVHSSLEAGIKRTIEYIL